MRGVRGQGKGGVLQTETGGGEEVAKGGRGLQGEQWAGRGRGGEGLGKMGDGGSCSKALQLLG